MNLVWHHILPYNEWRDLWNTLVTHCHGTQLAEARTALRHYLLLCDWKMREVDTWIDRIRAERLDVVDCNFLTTKAAWPAWNIVEGPDPRFRSDDPGDRFIDRYTHGLTQTEFGRMKSVEFLHPRLASVPLMGNLSAAALRSLADTLSMARSGLACDIPVPFRDSMWDRDASGKWSKRRTGERILPG